MSQRALFAVLSAVLFVACEDDTIVSLNAVNFTKSHLSDIAESARHAAEQTDTLAARLVVFTDSAAYAAAYNAAHALFNAAYAPDSSDPQAAAAEAYVTAAAEAARRGKNKAVLDSAYVTPPISTATAALATSKAAYLACATYIDSLLNSIE